jgi:hypothetical protein
MVINGFAEDVFVFEIFGQWKIHYLANPKRKPVYFVGVSASANRRSFPDSMCSSTFKNHLRQPLPCPF